MCFKFGCLPSSEKTDNRSKKSNEYFGNFLKLCNESIEDLLKKQANNALPHKMILNHELINSNGKAKKIYRIFTTDPEKKKYQGVGWVVTNCVPHCMICREEWSSFIVPNHCFACGNAVCQTFCAQDSALVDELEDLGPLRVCKLCHWGQERASLHRTFRPLSMVDYDQATSPAPSEKFSFKRTTTVAETSENGDSIIDLTTYSINTELDERNTLLHPITEGELEDEDAQTTSTTNPLNKTASQAVNSSTATTGSTGGGSSGAASSSAAVAACVVGTAAGIAVVAATTSSSVLNTEETSTNKRANSEESEATTLSATSSSNSLPPSTITPSTTTLNPLQPTPTSPGSPQNLSPSSSSSQVNLITSSPQVQNQLHNLIKEIPKPPRVKTGWLKISTNNGITWRKRFCTIQNGYLSYYSNDAKENNNNAHARNNNNNNNNNKLKGQICLAGYRYQLPSDEHKVSLRIDLFYEEEDGQLRVSNSEEMDVLIETIDSVEQNAWVQAIASHTDYIEKIHLHDRLVEEELESITIQNTSRNSQSYYP